MRRERTSLAALVTLVLLGTLIHAPSLFSPFIYDDRYSVLTNPNIRQLWPLWEAMSAPAQFPVAGRPMVSLSLAANYALAGFDVRGYHAFNIGVHVLCGLLLFGIVRRTLESPALRERFGAASTGLAFTCALLWILHPIQTECVTYITSRTETIMGFFYLLTLYTGARFFASPSAWGWGAASVLACALGMASKEAMVTAPVMVWLYDRTFYAGAFRRALRGSPFLYAGLAATWVVLLVLIRSDPRSDTVGFSLGVSAWTYALNQAVIVLHYLRLVFWPHPLLLEYGFAKPLDWVQVAPHAVVLGTVVAATLVALVRWPMLGFLGAWVFIILGPTSSFVPIISEIGSERRMYLPVAAPIVLGVIAIYALLRRISDRRSGDPPVRSNGLLTPRARLAAVTATLVVAGAYAGVSVARHRDYRSNIAIWKTVVRTAPDNPKGYFSLAREFEWKGKLEEAARLYRQAIELKPDYSMARVNLGALYYDQGRTIDAIRQYQAVIRSGEEYPLVHYNLGLAFESRRRYDRALHHFREELRLGPNHAPSWSGVAWILANHRDPALRDPAGAIEAASRAVELTERRNPLHLDSLAAAYAAAGRFDEAAATAEQALAAAIERESPQTEAIRARLELYREGKPYRLPEERRVPARDG